ncbi:WGR domain-containing protein [Phyllobacterium myrsinacearum]|uniref:Putative DNA-binding WGR domain protein n=1 Tax=Phyllobacterium myrsinacearum TaxID=28101 RepID=A0A839EXH4_9HYPH|nr:putative DNA-binding WGR domain protein [Phyllobacterium myrsinacearum]
MARFYGLAIRCWDRIGTQGQQKVQLFSHETEAVDIFLDLARVKRRRGYRPGLQR